MKKGNNYLVIKEGSDEIREWECLEVSEKATKVQDLVKRGFSLFTAINEVKNPFWILNTDFDTIGKTKYQIIEELNKQI